MVRNLKKNQINIINKTNKTKINKTNKIKKIKIDKVLKIQDIKKHDVLFDLDYLKTLLYSNNFINTVPIYMNKFFFKYGSDIFFDNGDTFELLNKNQAINKIPTEYKRSIKLTKNNKEITKDFGLNLYFSHELFLKSFDTKLVIDYDKDYKFVEVKYVKGFEKPYNCLNMKKDLPRNYNKVIEPSVEGIKAVELFFDHLKKVICSNDEYEFEVVKKFFASSCVGHKVKFALLWQTHKEQAGKGTVLNYMKSLLGNRMFKTSSIETVELYTKPFEGATLLNFDELPVSGTSKLLQDKMKSLITEPEFDCRAMHNQSYIQKNTFNIVITSNNNCISLTQSNQVRYYVNTIDESYTSKIDYFETLYKYINTEEARYLIYQEFVKIYETEVKPHNWIGNNLKITTAGKLKRIEALPNFYKWIKKYYITNGLGINEKCSDFLTLYQNENRNDRTTPNKIARYLQELGVNVKDKKLKNPDTNKYEREGRYYVISYEDLKNIYNTKGWFDELVDEIPEDGEILEDDEMTDQLTVDKSDIKNIKHYFENDTTINKEILAGIIKEKKDFQTQLENANLTIDKLEGEISDLTHDVNHYKHKYFKFKNKLKNANLTIEKLENEISDLTHDEN